MLRIDHDTSTDCGITPYELLLIRERNLAGSPRPAVHDFREAEEFLESMRALDKKIADALNAAQAKVEAERNKKRPVKAPFTNGTWVWLLKPRQVGAEKVEKCWKGPY